MADYIFEVINPTNNDVQGWMPQGVTATFTVEQDGTRKVATSADLDEDGLTNLRDSIQDFALRYVVP